MPKKVNKHAKVIICDDDEDDLFLIKSILEEMEFSHPTAYFHNGLELMDMLQLKIGTGDHHIGLILLDLNMPKMDGRETLHLLKSNPAYKRIPVVILTTSSSPKDVDLCYALGANSFITKPSSYDELSDVVNTTIKYWIDLSHLPSK